MIVVRALRAGDDLAGFDSGNRDLDRWVKRHGLANQHLYGVTYVAEDAGAIVGFVTVAANSVTRIGAAGGPPNWPVLLLGRMAVARTRQGRGIGAKLKLMKHVFELAVAQHRTVGCAAVVVDAKPDAVTYYQRYGFERLPSSTIDEHRMYLALVDVLPLVQLPA